MSIEIKTWAFDILNAIHEIELFLTDTPSFTAYETDLKTRRAIERNLEIIGEAMHRIQNKNPSLIFTNSRKIIETRNRIIHGYDAVSNEILWSILVSHIPLLKQEIEHFLNE